MPIDSLTAKANTGAGTDALAGRTTPGGFAGAVVGTNAAGDDWERLASEATLGALNAKTPALVSNRVPVIAGNITTKFREAFEAYTPGTRWTQTLGSGDIIALDGNSAAASYLVISKDPLSSGTESRLQSVQLFGMPFEAAFGIHTSQRTVGQEFAVEIISTETPLATPADLAISAIQQAASVLTVTTTTPHNLVPGMRIGIRGCADSRVNYPALVVATTPTPTQFTVTAGPAGALPALTAGPFATGFVFLRSAMGLAPNGTSMILENAVATNASFYVRAESGDALASGTIVGNHSVAIASTASVQAINAALTYAFQPTNEFRLSQYLTGPQWSDVPVDSLAAATNRYKRTQVAPNPAVEYAVRFRATNAPSLSRPVAQIVSAVKTGTTTATITTDVPHGLTTTDQVVIYGIRDQAATAFPNLLVATAIASVPTTTTFTIVIGTAGTVTSFGGYVARVNGGNLMSALGANASVIQSATRTANIVTIVGNVAWTGLLIGDYVNIVGVRNAVDGATLGIDGAYRVRDVVTTSLVLDPIGTTPTGANIGLTNCGGAVIKRTDLRISFVRVVDFDRQRIEIMPRPQGDISEAASVNVQNVPAVTVNSGALTSVATVSAVTSANLGIPGIIADVASAALTTTTTTAAIIPTFGTSYQVNIPVTAVTGTSPTLDVRIEESDDTGTNWFTVYEFPRITATGIYRSPVLPLTGNRIRYVQTVTGTTPSFTRAVNRLQSSDSAEPIRQLFDRSLAAAQALNAVTPWLTVQNCRFAQLLITAGLITTTAPALQLEGSDDNGLTAYPIGAPLTAVASSSVRLVAVDVHSQLIRARVSTAGVAAALQHVMLKGF
jgi:hypothetical protein